MENKEKPSIGIVTYYLCPHCGKQCKRVNDINVEHECKNGIVADPAKDILRHHAVPMTRSTWESIQARLKEIK